MEASGLQFTRRVASGPADANVSMQSVNVVAVMPVRV